MTLENQKKNKVGHWFLEWGIFLNYFKVSIDYLLNNIVWIRHRCWLLLKAYILKGFFSIYADNQRCS